MKRKILIIGVVMIVGFAVAGTGNVAALENKSSEIEPTTIENEPSEPNGDFSNAGQLSPGTHYGAIVASNGNDYFAVDLNQGQDLTVSMYFVHGDADLDLEVYDPNQNLVSDSQSTTDSEQVSITAQQSGTHYIRVYSFGDGTAPYTLDISLSETGDTEEEPNGDFFEADDVTQGSYVGTIGAPGTTRSGAGNDYFAVYLDQGQDLSTSIQFQHSDADLDLGVYDPNQNLVSDSQSTTDSEQVSITAQQSGTHYIRVYSYGDGTTPYILDVSPGPSNININRDRRSGIAYDGRYGYTVGNGEIRKFNLDTKEVVNSFDAPDGSRDLGLAYGDGSLWFADGIDPAYDGEVLELNPDTGNVRSRIDMSYDPTGLAFGDGSLWVADITTNEIHEYDTDGNELSSFNVPTTTPQGLAYFDGSVWLGDYCYGGSGCTASLYEFTTEGSLRQETNERGLDSENGGHGGLATTETELLGPDRSGGVTVLRTLGEDDTGSGSIENIDTTLMDTNGDGLGNRVEAEVAVSDVDSGQTTVELGESNFEIDVSPTDTADGSQAQFVTVQDPDGDGTNEAAEFVGIGTVDSAVYTVTADLSGQSDGETGTVNVELGGGVTASETYTLEEITGPLAPDNPFGDANGNPVGRDAVIDRMVGWNLDGEIDGTQYTRDDIVGYLVEWNLEVE